MNGIPERPTTYQLAQFVVADEQSDKTQTAIASKLNCSKAYVCYLASSFKGTTPLVHDAWRSGLSFAVVKALVKVPESDQDKLLLRYLAKNNTKKQRSESKSELLEAVKGILSNAS